MTNILESSAPYLDPAGSWLRVQLLVWLSIKFVFGGVDGTVVRLHDWLHFSFGRLVRVEESHVVTFARAHHRRSATLLINGHIRPWDRWHSPTVFRHWLVHRFLELMFFLGRDWAVVFGFGPVNVRYNIRKPLGTRWLMLLWLVALDLTHREDVPSTRSLHRILRI